jgi:hypothetical protein
LCPGDVQIDLRARPEGTRLKFWYDSNSLKFYNKEGAHQHPIALRLENTVNKVSIFKVFRVKEGEDAAAPKSWQQMRKGVADLPRRSGHQQPPGRITGQRGRIPWANF